MFCQPITHEFIGHGNAQHTGRAGKRLERLEPGGIFGGVDALTDHLQGFLPQVLYTARAFLERSMLLQACQFSFAHRLTSIVRFVGVNRLSAHLYMLNCRIYNVLPNRCQQKILYLVLFQSFQHCSEDVENL